MRVTHHSAVDKGDLTSFVRCELGDATVEVRRSGDGKCMVVVINGAVSMEPRAAAIWIVVK